MFKMNNLFNFRFRWKIKQKLTWNNIITQNSQNSDLWKLNDTCAVFPNYWSCIMRTWNRCVTLLRKNVLNSFLSHHIQNWEFIFNTKLIKAVHCFGHNFLTSHSIISPHSFTSASINYVPRSTSFLNKLFYSYLKVSGDTMYYFKHKYHSSIKW